MKRLSTSQDTVGIPFAVGKNGHKATLSALVLYEDTSTRERAMAACDDLVKKFWSDIHFNFDWWDVKFLEEDSFAEIATRSAANADMVIFSGNADKELALAAKRWFERWPRHRDGRDGALVDLTETANSLNGAAELKKIYLRDIAGRAFMDYMSKPPAAIHADHSNGRLHLH